MGARNLLNRRVGFAVDGRVIFLGPRDDPGCWERDGWTEKGRLALMIPF